MIRIKPTNRFTKWLFYLLNKTVYEGELIFSFRLPGQLLQNVLERENSRYFKILDYQFISVVVWNFQYIRDRIEMVKNAKATVGYGLTNRLGQFTDIRHDVSIEDLHRVSTLNKCFAGVFNKNKCHFGSINDVYKIVCRGFELDPTYANVYLHPYRRVYAAITGVGFIEVGIGDKIFDPNWLPSENDQPESAIKNFIQATKIPSVKASQAFSALPPRKKLLYFKIQERGDVRIKNFIQARISAKNISVWQR